MRIVTAIQAAMTAGAMVLAGPALAATQVVNGSGQLTGATGVVVGSSTYDVSFVDGACTTVFSPCTSSASFTFQTQADATAAANALLAQVISGTFDTDPSLTLGCTASFCTMIIPYAVSGTELQFAGANNGSAGNSVSSGTLNPTTFDLGQSGSQVFARFTLPNVPAVPEPASWAMMLLGFAGIGVAVRRRSAAPQSWLARA